MTDLDPLLPAIAAGDTVAFADWLALAEEPMRDALRSFARVVDTEAVLQESLLRVWQVAPKVQPDGRANSLLRVGVRIARNLAISTGRRARREIPGDEGYDDHLQADFAPPDPLLRAQIEQCRDQLPEQPRRALEARVIGGDADADLAARLRMRTNTFLQNVTRARKLLAECLDRHGVDLAQELR